MAPTTEKRHSFVGVFKFIGTDEYIQIIFVGPETVEYKLGTNEYMSGPV
jgi:hypothetical protein